MTRRASIRTVFIFIYSKLFKTIMYFIIFLPLELENRTRFVNNKLVLP